MEEWLYPIGVVLLGYTVLGLTGFGSALVVVPLLAPLTDTLTLLRGSFVAFRITPDTLCCAKADKQNKVAMVPIQKNFQVCDLVLKGIVVISIVYKIRVINFYSRASRLGQ